MELLDLGRVARRIGVTRQWLRAEADAGRIPCLRAGKRYLFNLAAVKDALAALAATSKGGAQ